MSGGRLVFAMYEGAGRLSAPLATPWLARRAARGKEDAERLAEKRGIASRAPFHEPPVWLHAVSAGESVAALALAERLAGAGLPVLLTTSTPTAAGLVARHEAERIVHQYAPLDAPPFLSRFLGHWRPRAAVFTESEVWPATLAALARRAVPRAHVNARLSARSFARWRRWPWLARALFSRIDLALAQSARQAERFAALGAPVVRATGNIKFDAPAPPVDAAELARLRAATAGRPLWLAASTHSGEEEAVLSAHAVLAARLPEVLTIVAPRHPDRADAVARLAARAGTVTRRSLGEAPAGDFHLVDTFGELGTFLALAPVVFLGGSLVPFGGHNPAEPAAHGSALVTGPDHGEMFEPFVEAGAARVVADGPALGAAVAALLADDVERYAMADRATATFAAERGALDRMMAELLPFIADGGRTAAP